MAAKVSQKERDIRMLQAEFDGVRARVRELVRQGKKLGVFKPGKWDKEVNEVDSSVDRLAFACFDAWTDLVE